MTVLPTRYCLYSINFKHGFWITFFPSKNFLQTLTAIWVVPLMCYNYVFPKVKNVDIWILIYLVTSPIKPKGLIKSIKTKFSQIIFISFIFGNLFWIFNPFSITIWFFEVATKIWRKVLEGNKVIQNTCLKLIEDKKYWLGRTVMSPIK